MKVAESSAWISFPETLNINVVEQKFQKNKFLAQITGENENQGNSRSNSANFMANAVTQPNSVTFQRKRQRYCDHRKKLWKKSIDEEGNEIIYLHKF